MFIVILDAMFSFGISESRCARTRWHSSFLRRWATVWQSSCQNCMKWSGNVHSAQMSGVCELITILEWALFSLRLSITMLFALLSWYDINSHLTRISTLQSVLEIMKLEFTCEIRAAESTASLVSTVNTVPPGCVNCMNCKYEEAVTIWCVLDVLRSFHSTFWMLLGFPEICTFILPNGMKLRKGRCKDFLRIAHRMSGGYEYVKSRIMPHY